MKWKWNESYVKVVLNYRITPLIAVKAEKTEEMFTESTLWNIYIKYNSEFDLHIKNIKICKRCSSVLYEQFWVPRSVFDYFYTALTYIVTKSAADDANIKAEGQFYCPQSSVMQWIQIFTLQNFLKSHFF